MRLSVAYEVTGRGAQVLFLHALGTDRHFWDFVIRELDDRFTCVLVDLPGHGASPPADGWTIEEAADLLPGVLADAAFEHAHVVGASMGGMVALSFARRHADLVGSVVVADARRATRTNCATHGPSALPWRVAPVCRRWSSTCFPSGSATLPQLGPPTPWSTFGDR